MRVLSLFSGIGTFEKALTRKGIPFELVNYCEFDKYASKAYSIIHNEDETKNLGDITKINVESLPNVDLITYGFPCQDISCAGKQRGFEDEQGNRTRSGLFFNALEIIEHCKPKVAIAENVKNLTSKRFAKEFRIVLDSLDQAGYNSYFKVLDTKDYGIPQHRERVFIVSIRKDIDWGMFQFPEPIELKLRLKDMLENDVDEKYYISEKGVSFIMSQAETRVDRTTKESDLTLISLAHGFNSGSEFDADIFPTIETGTCTKWHTLLVEKNSDKVMQIGNCKPTKTRQNPNQGRIYNPAGISPTLSTMGGGNREPYVIVRTNTKKGFDIATEEDSINLEQPNSTTRRGRVGHGVAQTLNTTCNQAVLQPKIDVIGNYSPSNHDASRIVSAEGIAPTVKENHGTVTATLTKDLRIRKLTPKECWRLQGFDDEDIDKCIDAKISNTQLYKMAGNSITVDVLCHIYDALYDEKGNVKYGG